MLMVKGVDIVKVLKTKSVNVACVYLFFRMNCRDRSQDMLYIIYQIILFEFFPHLASCHRIGRREYQIMNIKTFEI